jgi:hypothetical protein
MTRWAPTRRVCVTRAIALIAALGALAGCAGEAATTKKPQEKAPVTVADWQTDAHVACLRIQDVFVARAPRDLRQLRKRLPGIAREVRAAGNEIRGLEQPPDDDAVQQFVAALRPVETSVAGLVKASRRMDTGRLTTATDRFAPALVALAKSARRAGLPCLKGGVSVEIGAVRAPIAAERLAAIERRALARLRAANDIAPPTGPRNAIAALEAEDAALRALALPDWARDARAAFRRGCRSYRKGLETAIDRYNAGQPTEGALYSELIERPVQRCNRLMKRLWSALRARPVHGL